MLLEELWLQLFWNVFIFSMIEPVGLFSVPGAAGQVGVQNKPVPHDGVSAAQL